MEFLKEILGDELFKQFKEKVDAFNGDEANKDKQIKLANLAGGEYVGKGKYDALQEAMNGKDSEITNANKLIEELKKASKGDEELQGKFAKYEQENAKLQAELAETKLKSAIKVALLSEKAMDVDYLTFKLEQKLKDNNQTLELDENENIKGWDNLISGLKTQFPTQFEGSSSKKIDEHKLDDKKDEGSFTREDILKMPYAKRAELAAEQPDVYDAAMKS